MIDQVRHSSVLLAAALAATAVAVPAAALAGSDSSPIAGRTAQSHTVVLKDIRFHPGDLSIHRGESVTWVWRDGDIEHNVTGGGFHSRTQSSGSFTVRFPRAGTFRYRCTIHVKEGMVGEVVVH
jgi:plastocyanin